MPTDHPDLQNDPRNQKQYYFETTPLRRVVVGTARLAFKALVILQPSGLHHLPARGGVVLVANHVTNFDVFPIQIVLPRPIFFMAKAELHQNPLMDAALRRLGAFPVQRGARDDWSIEHARRVLDHGQVLGIFPEGRRNHGAGLRPAKTGAARLAIQAGCPLLPLAINGTHRIFSGFPRRTLVQIQLGSPIYPDPGETVLSLTDRMMFALAAMLPEEQRGVYREHPGWL